MTGLQNVRFFTALVSTILLAPFFWVPICNAEQTGAEQPWLTFDEQVTWSTPPGITIVYVDLLEASGSQQRLWTRLGNDKGEALFISDQDADGVSLCTGQCEQDFPPVIALPDSIETGEWTLFQRDNGDRQWVYRGKPLYRFAHETRFNEMVDNLAMREPKKEDLDSGAQAKAERDIRKTMGAKKDRLWNPLELMEPTSLTLPEGWSLAKFDSKSAIGDMPSDILLKEIAAISSIGFVDMQGMTVYGYDGDVEDISSNCVQGCNQQWIPLPAAEMSRAVGDFQPIRRANGDLQWSYKGVPLFTWKGDIKPGYANGSRTVRDARRIRVTSGDNKKGEWYIPVQYRHFVPQNAQIRKEPSLGKIFATADGMPLYSRFRSEYFNTAHNSYVKGKLAGTNGCDAICLETWRPFLAPEGAQTQGYWEIVEREDGTRQWAYKGFVQYINVNDKPYSRSVGNRISDPVIGDDGRFKVREFISGRLSQEWARGITYFWELTSP